MQKLVFDAETMPLHYKRAAHNYTSDATEKQNGHTSVHEIAGHFLVTGLRFADKLEGSNYWKGDGIPSSYSPWPVRWITLLDCSDLTR